MNRALLLLPFAAIASGCYVAPAEPIYNDVVLYWEFQRFVVGGAAVGYDTNVSPGGGNGACLQSGVDSVDISDAAGRPIVTGVPCVFQGVQGVLTSGFLAGTYTLQFDGFRGNNRLYSTRVDVTVVDRGANQFSVVLPGIPDELDIFADFFSQDGTTQFTTCANARVLELDYAIVDRAGTQVASGTVSCVDPAGVSFTGAQALDRDTYRIRLQGFESGVPTAVLDSASTVFACATPSFSHYGQSTGAAGWAVSLYDVAGNATRCP